MGSNRGLTPAILLAVIATVVAAAWGARTGGGSDSYGYVSQADLWLSGSVHIEQEFCADFPWPFPGRTVEPLGYRQVSGPCAIVPQYAPGLPLLMAAGKALVGQCGIFAVVPLAVGVLVFGTYLLGCALGRPLVGLGAAALVAASPTVVWMSLWPMSDVPAAALWTLAVVGALRRTRASVAAAGAAAAMAILVRPNLVPLAGVIAAWLFWRRARPLWFALPAALGAAFIAFLNHRLYGAAIQSGYQPLETMFEAGNIVPNLRLYGTWLIQKEGLLTIVGLAGLAVPSARIWPGTGVRASRWLLAGIVAVVIGIYLPYGQFDAWWYLRFLLPASPMLAIGAVSAAAALGRVPAVVFVAIAAAGGVWLVGREHPESIGLGESIYATVGRSVRGITGPDAVVMTEQHSGTVRYYGGRMTLRWKRLNPGWIDAAADYLQTSGHHPYLLIERGELPYLKEKYGETNQIGRLNWSPVMTFRHGDLSLYDLVDRAFQGPPIDIADPERPNQCWTPAPPPRFRRR